MCNLFLFTQSSCRPCKYSLSQLQKQEGWEDHVTVIELMDGDDRHELAKRYGVYKSPVLLAVDEDDNVLNTIVGSTKLCRGFWKTLIDSRVRSSHTRDA